MSAVSPADGCDPAAIRDPSPERERLISPLAGVEISDDKEAEMSKARFEDEVQGHGQRELDRRTSDGIDVRLLWDALTDRVSLALSDERSGESFLFEVDPRDADRLPSPVRVRDLTIDGFRARRGST
jgi:hypothetical protein